MSNIVAAPTRFAATTARAREKIDRLTEEVLKLPQLEFVTEHLLHAGMYTRTLLLPKDTLLTAVFIARPTVLISVGDVDFWSNDKLTHFTGYNVIPGSAERKVALYTHSLVGLSMILPCTAKTVDEAQRYFTPEFERLVPLSLEKRHRILITGE